MKWDTELKFTNASFKMTAYYPKEGDYIVLEQSLNDVMFQLVMKFLKTYKKISFITMSLVKNCWDDKYDKLIKYSETGLYYCWRELQ